jgi:hypothetical protein
MTMDASWTQTIPIFRAVFCSKCCMIYKALGQRLWPKALDPEKSWTDPKTLYPEKSWTDPKTLYPDHK